MNDALPAWQAALHQILSDIVAQVRSALAMVAQVSAWSSVLAEAPPSNLTPNPCAPNMCAATWCLPLFRLYWDAGWIPSAPRAS
jgi:hypothetical protein